MLKIAVCDNDPVNACNIRRLIEENFSVIGIIIEVRNFPEQLISMVSSGIFFDIIMTETEFRQFSGIELAATVRKYDKNAAIIFVSKDSACCVESYTVNAYNYMLKPLNEKNFIQIIKKCIESIQHTNLICLPVKYGIIRRTVSETEYICVYKKNIEYHFTDGSTEYYTGYLKSIENKILQYPCFYKALRSIIINMDHVKKVQKGEVIMRSGYTFTANKNKSKEVSDHILCWLDQEQ